MTLAGLLRAGVRNQVKNPMYKTHLASLNHMVLVEAAEDMIVVPKQSTQFSFYGIGQDKTLTTMVDSRAYKEDWLRPRLLTTSTYLVFLIHAKHTKNNFICVFKTCLFLSVTTQARAKVPR